MSRIIICIPFLLFFVLLYPRGQGVPDAVDTQPDNRVAKPSADWFGVLGSTPVAGFPAGLSWHGLFRTLQAPNGESEPLPDPDIMRFLTKCLDRYDREIRGYTGTLYKQERVHGKLNNPEIIQFEFKEKPHSVYMKWLKGAGLASATLFVNGENDNKMLVLPIVPLFIKTEDPYGAMAKNSARYTIDEFGIKLGTVRTYNAWQKKQAENILHVEYEGVFFVEKLGNRPCYKIHRSKLPSPEDDGVLDVVLYIDTETWLQVGTTLLGKNGELIAHYYFRDLVINPDFPPGHFSRNLLNKK